MDGNAELQNNKQWDGNNGHRPFPRYLSPQTSFWQLSSLSTTFFLNATTLHSAVKCSSWNKYLDLWLVHPYSCQNIQEMCINHCHCSQTFNEIVNGFVTFLTLEISCFPSACVGDLQYLSNVELYSHNVETICMFYLVIYLGTKGKGDF